MYNVQVEDDIQEILDEFDWVRVIKTMKALEWRWVGVDGFPCLYDLQVKARGLLSEAAKAVLRSPKKKYRYMVGTGGFEVVAQKFKDTDKIYLELKFVVTTWGNYE